MIFDGTVRLCKGGICFSDFYLFIKPPTLNFFSLSWRVNHDNAAGSALDNNPGDDMTIIYNLPSAGLGVGNYVVAQVCEERSARLGDACIALGHLGAQVAIHLGNRLFNFTCGDGVFETKLDGRDKHAMDTVIDAYISQHQGQANQVRLSLGLLSGLV